MNLDTAVSKLETIASRINDPIHIGGFESSFEGKSLGVLIRVKEIYVFGSAVYADDPNDLDLFVVTERTDQMNWSKFCKEISHASEYWKRRGITHVVKNTLRKKMRNVDIHVDTPITVTDLRILVWSPEKPNVKENFLTGRENVDLSGECRSLRKQLKTATAKNYVLEKLCRMYRKGETRLLERHGVFRGRSTLSMEELIEARTLQNLDECFTKKDLPRLKLFFEEYENSYWRYTAFDLIKKFIEIKEQKGSKKIFERLDWDPKARARAEEQDEWDRTERKKGV